jgi:RHS repeat-associated protein
MSRSCHYRWLGRSVSLRKRGWVYFALIALSLLGSLDVRGETDSVFLLCQMDYIPPLIDVNFPNESQTAICEYIVLTDPSTPSGVHSISPYNVNSDFTLTGAGFPAFFNVFDGGIINSTTSGWKDSKGNITYGSTVGYFDITGNNLPFSSTTPTAYFPPTYGEMEFILDSVDGETPPPQNVNDLIVVSDFNWDEWALQEYLFGTPFDFEGPYVPHAKPPSPKHKQVMFVLWGPGHQAPNQPFATMAGPPPDPDYPPPPGSGAPGDPGPGPHCPCQCMAVAAFDRFQAGIAIEDTPIVYTPGVGGPMPFTVSYHSRYATAVGSTMNYSNIGPQWLFNWLTHVGGGPANGLSEATHYTPYGDKFTYGGYEQTVVQGIGQPMINQGDFQDNQGWTHATLHYRQGPERYELWEANGSKQIFAQGVGAAGSRQFFLTSMQDPQGNVTTVSYDQAAAANGQAIITAVTDPKSGQLTFSYGSSDPLKITKVTRSGDGLSAKFTYTSSGQLASSTDTGGITSSFAYESGDNFVNSMTTPYGTTTFNSTAASGSFESDMTNPLGQTERVEYHDSLDASLTPASDTQVPSATGLSIDNSHLNCGNSYYWNRRAMADAAGAGTAVDSAGFYAIARVTHWAQSSLGTIPVPLCYQNRLQSRIWYNYPNQPNADSVDVTAAGASTQPSVTARVLDGGTTQATFVTYNTQGMVTQSVDPVGRTTNYTYDTNGIDLLQVSQVNGAGQDVLSALTYNSQHEPLTVTDASGQVTTLTYNGQGQPLTKTDAKGETTTLAYYWSGHLHTVTAPATGATTTYTYDSAGRVHTVTDSEGYVMTVSYDNNDRPVRTSYPDGTSDQLVYDKLDVGQSVDRQGRVTRNRHDAIRELMQTTDPLGRATKYTYCTCGAVSSITDANNNTTTFNLDGLGRRTAKIYADSSQITYLYETDTSRLHSMTDVRGDTAVYAYNADNTLASTTYTTASGVASTPNVSFAYDSVYNRVTGMSDGTGTTSYSYNAIPAGAASSPTTGAGQLGTISTPIAGSSAAIAYGYDQLGRVTSRTVDGGSEVDTTFDSLGRVTNASNPLGAFTYAYVDETSRLAGVTYPSGTTLSTTYSYFDNTGDQRLQEIKNLKGSSVLSQFDYTYNPVGTIATWKQQTDSNTPTQYALSYDGADQLAGAVQTNTSTSATVSSNAYNYDPAGNRMAETTLSATNSGQFNSLNQLTHYGTVSGTQTVAGTTSGSAPSVTINGQAATVTSGTNFTANVPLPSGTNVVSIVAQPSSGSATTQRFQFSTSGTAATALTYDADGNTLTDENGNTYQWDALNRLTQITYPSGATSLFAYDGLSRRVQIVEKDSSGTVTSTKNLLWVGQQLAEERDGSNTVTKRFFAQGEQQSGTSYYYTFDHLGSIREMSDGSGTLEARYSYDPYGRTTKVSGSLEASFQYAGYYQHAPSGVSLTLYRAYDPTTGKWLSRDPMEERVGTNLFGYVNQNPIIGSDPLGLDVAIVISGYAGGDNVFGHAAAGVTANGAYSFGTKENLGSSFTTYLADRSALTVNTVFVVPATPAQDLAFIKAFRASVNSGYHAVSNNCATAVANGLAAAGLTSGTPLLSIPGNLDNELSMMSDMGDATRIVIPENGSSPASLNQFNPIYGPPAPSQ